MFGKLTVLLLVACVALSEAAKFKKLSTKDHPVPYCTNDEILGCVGEISGALFDCGLTFDIVGCIQDILGASNCGNCICDVLAYLGLDLCYLEELKERKRNM
ncbi:uncharacterized protein LOC111713198 [Eurytemora carolleeae]|uniref:uncharacterized protein LOC111713198 n=1 Tax=Eurytemora carolleeae TaxID=1294199 RepID=UPI000C7608C1|nr:uncharacterized protein LOC111713198 [Eurytemora carolleeae]|eukprot:XP_023343785.1 uncharacterized protein LOC111713198 [Eurytemora affinis]